MLISINIILQLPNDQYHATLLQVDKAVSTDII